VGFDKAHAALCIQLKVVFKFSSRVVRPWRASNFGSALLQSFIGGD
jgi:hypothetical protein